MRDCVYFNFRKGWRAWVFRSTNAGTVVGQQHATTETSRPLSTGQTPVVVCKVSGPPVLCYASHWAHGAQPHIHPAVTFGGPYWHSVCDGLRVFLVLGQYFRIVVFMRLRILATIAIDPLFEITRTFMAINSCTSPEATSAQAASHHPPPWADSASAFFFLALNRHTRLPIGHPFPPAPFGFTPAPRRSSTAVGGKEQLNIAEPPSLDVPALQLVQELRPQSPRHDGRISVPGDEPS